MDRTTLIHMIAPHISDVQIEHTTHRTMLTGGNSLYVAAQLRVVETVLGFTDPEDTYITVFLDGSVDVWHGFFHDVSEEIRITLQKQ